MKEELGRVGAAGQSLLAAGSEDSCPGALNGRSKAVQSPAAGISKGDIQLARRQP